MSATPTPFNQTTDFSDHSDANPTTPHSGTNLDIEFAAVELALDETQSRLAEIQNDDGTPQNASVGLDQLKTEVTVQLGSSITVDSDDVSNVSGVSGSTVSAALGTNATAAATALSTANTGVSNADSAQTTADSAFNTAAYATVVAAVALPKAGGAMTGAITTNSTFDGRDVATDGTKLDGIESAATADQSDAEIETAFTNQVAQVSAGEITAGTEAALRQHSPADIKSFVDTHGGGGGGGLQTTGGAMTGAITTNSTFDGRDVATDGAALDTLAGIAQVSAGEITAGTETGLRTVSPADVKSFVDTHGGGSSAHAASHEDGGADELDAGILNSVYVPFYYTEDDAAGNATTTTNLDAHLGGIDTALSDLYDSVGIAESTINDHLADTGTNPHAVSASDVSLGSVNNYGLATEGEAQTGSSHIKYMTPLRVKDAIDYEVKPYLIAVSDETTALTTGTAKITFRCPFAATLTSVRASVGTAPTGAGITVDINEAGTSVLSTKLTIDATEKTSTTAATAAVISDSALADDAEMTIDIDVVGSTIAGAGLKVILFLRHA